MTANNETALVDYLRILRRQLWVIAIVVWLAVGAAFAYLATRPPSFEAEATVLIRSGTTSNFFAPTPGNPGALFRNLGAEAQFAGSSDLRREAGVIPRASAASVQDDAVTSVLRFRVVGEESDFAVEAATSWASTYVAERHAQDLRTARQTIATTESTLELLREEEAVILAPIAPIDAALARTTLEPDDVTRLTTQRLNLIQQLNDELLPVTSQIQTLSSEQARQELLLRFLEDDPEIAARVLSTPSEATDTRPPLGLTLISAALLGLLVGVPVALLSDGLAGRVHGEDELARALPDLTILGLLPRSRKMVTADVIDVARVKSDQRYFEAVQSVVTALQMVGQQTPISSLLITSPEQGAGKTTISASLAVVLADDMHRVAVVDADVRRPRLGRLLGAESDLGLSDVVSAGADLSDAFAPAGTRAVSARAWPRSSALVDSTGSAVENLLVLNAGTRTAEPTKLLRLATTHDLLIKLQDEADLTIVDCAPVMPVSDPLVLAADVSIALLVIRIGQTRLAEVVESVERLETAGIKSYAILVGQKKHQKRYGYGP